MKILSLNIWEGEVLEPLKEFISSHSKEVDVFCFQEMLKSEHAHLFDDIQKLLPDFAGYFTEQVPGVGLASFVRQTIKVDTVNSYPILSAEELAHLKMEDGSSYYPRVVQTMTLTDPKITILNFHGVPGDLKKDNVEREMQTAKLMKVLESYSNPKILIGDFNLNPDTHAIAELESKMANLIKNSEYKTTRSSLYNKRQTMPFADYAFVSPEINVQNFKVLPNEVSDHLALYIEF